MRLHPFVRLWLLRREVFALLVAAGDPRTPPLARLMTVASVLYLLLPFDLVPEFIPILGLLDDLVLVPLGLSIAHTRVPASILAHARVRAKRFDRIFTGALILAFIFILGSVAVGLSLLWRFL